MIYQARYTGEARIELIEPPFGKNSVRREISILNRRVSLKGTMPSSDVLRQGNSPETVAQSRGANVYIVRGEVYSFLYVQDPNRLPISE